MLRRPLVLRDSIEPHDHGDASVVVVCTAMIALGSGHADLSHTLEMRGRSPCVRETS